MVNCVEMVSELKNMSFSPMPIDRNFTKLNYTDSIGL
jgi:hypothetical protein